MMRSDGTGVRLVLHRQAQSFPNRSSPTELPLAHLRDEQRGARVIGEAKTDTWVVGVDGSGLRRIGIRVVGFNLENPQWTR